MRDQVKVRFDIGNVYTDVRTDEPYVLALIDKVTRYKKDGFQFMKGYKNKDPKFDEYIHLFNVRQKKLPTGLVPTVLKALREEGDILVSKKDNRTIKDVSKLDIPVSITGIKLRDSQRLAVEAAVQKQRGIIQAVTGFGKTETIAGIIEALQLKTIILVPSKSLMIQTAQRMQERLKNSRVGVIGDGTFDVQDITVATLQSLARYSPKEIRQICSEFGCMVIDEAHHTSTALAWAKVPNNIDAFYRFGMSATPFKEPIGSELRLIGATAKPLFVYGMQEGVNDSVVVPPHVYCVDFKSGISVDGEYTYEFLERTLIIENKDKVETIVDLCAQADELKLATLVIVNKLAHGEALSKDTGYPFVTGSWSGAKRKAAFNDLASGKINGIISTVVSEGVDIPEISMVVLAGGGKAKHLAIQRVGRGIRKKGKPYCIVFDFVDTGHKVVERHNISRRNAYKANNIPVSIVQTPFELSNIVQTLDNKYIRSNA